MSTRTLSHRDVDEISVENFGSGLVSLERGSAADTVEGTLDAGDGGFLDAVQVRQDRGHLRITMPRRTDSGSAHLRLQVPPGLSLDVSTGSADVLVSADLRRSRVTTGSGDIGLGDAEDVTCTTGSGDITVRAVRGTGARLTTGSGDVVVDEAHCPVAAKSGSGDVTVRTVHHSDLQASSGSGDISVPATSGSVDLRSASGALSVGIAEDLPAWLDLHSVSGRVRIGLEAGGAPDEGQPYVSVRARTASGSISVFRA